MLVCNKFKNALIGTTAIIGASFLLAPISIEPAIAQTISSTTTNKVTLGAGGVLIVTTAGVISTTNPAVDILAGINATSINNSGAISGSSTGINIATSGDITGGIINSGAILGGSILAGAIGISIDPSGNISGGINNSGTIAGFIGGISVSSADISGGIVNQTSAFISGLSFAIQIFNSTYTGAINNSGVIIASSTAINILGSSDITGGITNSGLIFGTTGDGIVIRTNSDVSGGITNSGVIAGSTASTGFAGIDVIASNLTGLINNSGLITGSDGIFVAAGGDISGGIINTLGATIGGSTASTGINVISANISGQINNSGTISGIRHGIIIETNADISGGVVNSGLIAGGMTGFVVENNSGALISLNNSGTISGTIGILVNTSSDMGGGIINSGTISGTTGILVTAGSDISGGITTSGSIIGTGGTAISLVNLTQVSAININGGIITGDVIDGNPGGGFSIVTIGANFTSTDDFDVSDFNITAGDVFTMGAGTDISVAAAFTVDIAGRFNTSGVGSTITGDAAVSATGIFHIDEDFSISGDASNAGELFIGAGDTLTVGTLTDGGGNFIIEVDDSVTEFGVLSETGGAADITTSTVEVEVGIGSIAPGDEMLIIDSTAAITGAPVVATAVVDDSFLWDFTIIDGANAAAATDNTDLFLQVAIGNGLVAAANTIGNANAGLVLQSLAGSANIQIQKLLLALNSASTVEALNLALEAIQPTMDGGQIRAALDVTLSAIDITDDRLASLRSSSSILGMAAGNISKGIRMWGQGYFTDSNQDRRDNIGGYNADTAGFVMGMDTENIGNNNVFGIALSVSSSEIDSKNTNEGNTDIDSYQVTLYADHDLNHDKYISGMLAYTYHDNTTQRNPAAGLTANGEYDANQFTARAEMGKGIIIKKIEYRPHGSIHWTHYAPDNYTETGAGGANLTVDGDSLNILELGVGFEASWLYLSPGNRSHIEPSLNVGYKYDVIGDEVEMTSSFQGGGAAFKSEGFDPAQSTFNAGLGVKTYSGDGWEYGFEYSFEYKEDYDAHSGYFRSGYKF